MQIWRAIGDKFAQRPLRERPLLERPLLGISETERDYIYRELVGEFTLRAKGTLISERRLSTSFDM